MVKNSKQRSKTGKPATMRDVALLAGVSQPTVSRVLNQNNTTIPISEETRAKVMEAVEVLNYKPNVLARSLRTQQTQMIAVMIADISNSFYHPIVRVIQDIARKHDYDVMIANSDHIKDNEVHFCETVSQRPVDGVIMVPIHLKTEDIVKFSRRTNTAVTVLGPQITHPQIDAVYVDDTRAIYDATYWLIKERGHKHFGFIGVPDNLHPGPRRFEGFMKAMNETESIIQPKHIVHGDFSMESGHRAARQLIEAGDLPSVVVVLNDLMAIGAILEFQEAGYRVPDDIAVLGFDNLLEATIVRPALTTIAQNPTDIGYKLAERLFARIENPNIDSCRLESLSELIVRDSA